MRKILTFVCVALLMAGLCGCEKPDMSKLEGTWSEQYAPPGLCDGWFRGIHL